MKQTFLAALAATTCVAYAQHTVPDTWLLVGPGQGWPQEKSGRAIHGIHTPPTSLAMGNRGTINFFGRNNDNETFVRTHTWVPPMAWQAGNGTFGRSDNTLNYEAFCCGHTLMEDGRVVIAGSNFGSTSQGANFPGPQVAIYSHATNTWIKMIEDYELNKSRYYPSVYRLPDGRIATFGGQAEKNPAKWVDEPYEINPNKTTLLAEWQMPIEENWDFLNYPHLFPISATELFFPGPYADDAPSSWCAPSLVSRSVRRMHPS